MHLTKEWVKLRLAGWSAGLFRPLFLALCALPRLRGVCPLPWHIGSRLHLQKERKRLFLRQRNADVVSWFSHEAMIQRSREAFKGSTDPARSLVPPGLLYWWNFTEDVII